MGKLEKERVSLSVSSLRAYGLTEELLDEIQKVRATGLTFAPEAGSQRMRDVVNKNVTEEQLMETAERVFSRGWSKMKLYFMIGLPTEDADDVAGIVETGARARDVGRRAQKGKTPEVTVSVSTFVPKPHTPFQWCAMDTRELVLEKQALLKQVSRQTRVKLRMHDSEGSWLEGVLARGDRTLCDSIERAYHNGARFDCWEDKLELSHWVEAFEHFGVETGRFLGTIPLTAKLPWDHISVGLDDGFLAKEYRKAVKNRLSPPCGKAAGAFVHHTNVEAHDADAKKLVCYHCGVACDLTQMRGERRDFLIKLGALTKKTAPRQVPGEERELDVEVDLDAPSEGERVFGAAEAEAEDGPAPLVHPAVIREPKKQRRGPTANFDQGKPVRVRIMYTKLGRAAFRGHLDLVRLLPRIFRRLDLPMYYSQGFHPKPEMMFGPALPLGVASFAEYVDVKLIETPGLDGAAIHERLTGISLESIEFSDAVVLEQADVALSKVITRADYVGGLPAATLRELGLADAAALAEHVAARVAGPMTVVRDMKGIKRNIDVKQYLREVEVGAGQEQLHRAGISGDLTPFAFSLHVPGQGGARATEVLEALLGTPDPSARLVRTYMGMTVLESPSQGPASAITPMQLAAIRALQPPPAPREPKLVASDRPEPHEGMPVLDLSDSQPSLPGE
jgi:radical SAM-linked protein